MGKFAVKGLPRGLGWLATGPMTLASMAMLTTCV
jgi:hypothetical protein